MIYLKHSHKTNCFIYESYTTVALNGVNLLMPIIENVFMCFLRGVIVLNCCSVE